MDRSWLCARSARWPIYVRDDMISAALRNVIKTTQDYMADNTTLGTPALLQTEETHRLLFGNARISTQQLGAHARVILSGSRKWMLLLLVSSVLWGLSDICTSGWSCSGARIPKYGGNMRRTRFLRERLVTRVSSKVDFTEMFVNNLVLAQFCKVETSVGTVKHPASSTSLKQSQY